MKHNCLFAILVSFVASSAFCATQTTDDGYTWTFERNGRNGVRITSVTPDLSGTVALPSTLGELPVTDVRWNGTYPENTVLTSVVVSASLADSFTGGLKAIADIGPSEYDRNFPCDTNNPSWMVALTRFHGLKKVEIEGDSKCWATFGESVYTKDGTILFFRPSGATTLTLPATARNRVRSWYGGDETDQGYHSCCDLHANLSWRSTVRAVHLDAIKTWADADWDAWVDYSPDGNWQLFQNAEEVTNLVIEADMDFRSDFRRCSSLLRVTIAPNVTVIPSCLFESCPSLVEVVGGEGLMSVGQGAFARTPYVDESPDGFVWLGDSWIVAYNGEMPETLSIPEGVVGCSLPIGDDVLHLIIPDSLRYGVLGTSGCRGCCGSAGTKLESVCVSSVEKWVERTFEFRCSEVYSDGDDSYSGYDLYAGDKLVRTVTIPGAMKTVPDYLFRSCRSLQKIVIEDGVTAVGKSAFHGCTGLMTAEFPDSLKSVGYAAFHGCVDLAFNMPLALESIGTDDEWGDDGCSLSDTYTWQQAIEEARATGELVYLGNWCLGWPYDSDDYYWACETQPVPACPSSVTIRSGTRIITDRAFCGWRSLSRVTLPDSVEMIGNSAFRGTGLTKVVLPRNLRSLGRCAFGNANLSALPSFPPALENLGACAFGGYYDCDLEGTPWYAQQKLGFLVKDGWLLGYKRYPCHYDKKDGCWHQDVETERSLPNPVVIPKGVKRLCSGMSIGDYYDLVLPEGIETVPMLAFHGDEICALTIPVSVKTIGAGAFAYADGPISFFGEPPQVDMSEPDGSSAAFSESSVGYFIAGTPGWTNGMTFCGMRMEERVLSGGKLVPGVMVEFRQEGDGKVTGITSGGYVSGTKLNMKATAAKNSVFAGWYGDRAANLPLVASVDYRTPSLQYVLRETNETICAKFIPIADDCAAISLAMEDEYATGSAISPVAIDVSGCASLPTVKLSGLPTGLKYDAKTNTITGTPTKSGVYTVVATVTTAGKKTASASQVVVVRKIGEKIVKLTVPSVEGVVPGKVTGAGVYAKGKMVSVKATANKGYVFAGWYDGETLLSKDASWSFAMGKADLCCSAEFITNEEDREAITLAVNGVSMSAADVFATNLTCGVVVNCPILSDGLSATTVKSTPLPAGLKLVQDKTTKAYSVTGVPTAASKTDRQGNVQPTLVKFTVTTAGKNSREFQMKIWVEPLPAFVVGSFDGGGDWGPIRTSDGSCVWDENGDSYQGVSTLTISSSGKVSGKMSYVREDDGTVLSATLEAKFIAARDGDVFYLDVTRKIGKLSSVVRYELFEVEGLGGHINTEGPELYQNCWKRTDMQDSVPVFVKSHKVKLDNGLTLTIKKGGAVSFSGKVVGDGGKLISVFGAAQIYPEDADPTVGIIGRVILYSAPKNGLSGGFCDIVPIAVEYDGDTMNVSYATAEGRVVPISWKEGRFEGDIPRSSYLSGACYPAVFDLSANVLTGRITDIDGTIRNVGPIKLKAEGKDTLVGTGRVLLMYYYGYSTEVSSLSACDIRVTVLRQMSGDKEWGVLSVEGGGGNVPTFSGLLVQRESYD